MQVEEIFDADKWDTALKDFDAYDAYHTHDYNALCARQNSTTAVLLKIKAECGTILFPLLKRALSSSHFGECFDYTSSYGYPGPLISGTWTADTIAECWKTVAEYQKSINVIGVTSRLNPYYNVNKLLENIGQVRSMGEIIAINTSIPVEEQLRFYRNNHRRDLRKLKKNGFTCKSVDFNEHLSNFQVMYSDLMTSHRASSMYFFDNEYFMSLFTNPKFNMELYACMYDCEPVCYGCFFMGGNVCHYHLGATRDDFRRQAPSKLLFDHVRDVLAKSYQGCKWFNLGGGLGGRNDSLLKFKSGFSDVAFTFNIFASIFDEEKVAELTSCRRKEAIQAGKTLNPNYLPAYKANFV